MIFSILTYISLHFSGAGWCIIAGGLLAVSAIGMIGTTVRLGVQASRGSCLLGSTPILFENGNTKAIMDVRVGDVILDGGLNPVDVLSVVTNYLYDRRLYEFKDGPIFTEDHLFYSDLENEKLGI